MKKVLYSLIAASLFLASCGSDDGPVLTHEMGTWDLDSYILTNVPAAYDNNEGSVFDISDISFGGVSFESYILTLNSDGTFDREVEVPGPNINDNGTWELDGDDLTLSSEDASQDEEYAIERNENDQLWWSVEVNFSLLPNAVSDTITQAWVDTITDEEFFALFDVVSVDLIYAFERQ